MVDESSHKPLEWRAPVTLLLCLIGLGISAYTLWVHVQPTFPASPNTGAFDCRAVYNSPAAAFLGIPVPYLGVLFFLVMGVLCLPQAWESPHHWIHWSRVIVGAIGVMMVFHLVYSEAFQIYKVCLWCTGVHAVTIAIFLIALFSTPKLAVEDGHVPPSTSGGQPSNDGSSEVSGEFRR